MLPGLNGKPEAHPLDCLSHLLVAARDLCRITSESQSGTRPPANPHAAANAKATAIGQSPAVSHRQALLRDALPPALPTRSPHSLCSKLPAAVRFPRAARPARA